jgi:hypothetical protein
MRTLRKILQTQRVAAMWVLAVAVMFFAAGCSSNKNLTPSSAGRLGLTFNYVPYLRQAGFGAKTFVDYNQNQVRETGSANAMHRLLEAGLLEQRVETTSYPNLTGIYEDMGAKTVTHYDWAHIRYVSTKKLIGLHPLTLSMQQGSTAISGSYTYTIGDDGDCKGAVSGRVDADGGIDLDFRNTGSSYCPTPVDRHNKWNVQSVDGGGLKLVGPVTVYNAKSVGIITLTTYRYLLTKKFDGITPDGLVKIGQYHVDSVTNLLLDTDVSAWGNYAWHIDYNEIGQAITGVKSTSGTGQAEFRKQPDGNWVCFSH